MLLQTTVGGFVCTVGSATRDTLRFTPAGTPRPNEDRIVCAVGNQTVLSGVYDGMGGTAGGGIASTIASDCTLAQLPILESMPLTTHAHAELWGWRLIAKIQQQMTIEVSRDPTLVDMGTLMELMLVSENNLWLFHMGDSRTYHFDGTILRQVTTDQENQKGWVTNYIGFDTQWSVFRPTIEHRILTPGIWLSCSDGLASPAGARLRNREIEYYLTTGGNAEQKAERMVAAARALRSEDDITAVVLEVTVPA